MPESSAPSGGERYRLLGAAMQRHQFRPDALFEILHTAQDLFGYLGKDVVMGGGVPGGRVKAVQTGGPSGGCIPAEHLDTPVDYESLTRLGAIMGSGGMIVVDQDTNMVEVARFFMGFCRDESCGKCIPCRAGTVQMHGLLTKIAERRANRADFDRLLQLCGMVRETSLCGLGQSAPNPVLSTVRYFGDEFRALLQ